MDSPFICHDEFKAALKEVDILIGTAEVHQKKPLEYAIFNKACLLFLVGKFEVFLEDAIAEYVFKLAKMRLLTTHMPEIIKLHSSKHLIDEQFLIALKNLRPSAAERLKELSLLWNTSHVLETIKINNSFNYGKHGQNEIKKLFARIGIEDVFKECIIYEDQESLSEDIVTSRAIDVAATVNSMTGIRNNILHNDATPNLTHLQILEYTKHLILFANRLVDLLDAYLSSLKLSIEEA